MDKALFIFLLTYAALAVGQPPIFRIDRAGAALIGASPMAVTNVLDIDAAYRAIDYRTIVVLFCLMIVVANLPPDNKWVSVFAIIAYFQRTPKLVSIYLSAFFGIVIKYPQLLKK